jgi:hypothetical protein
MRCCPGTGDHDAEEYPHPISWHAASDSAPGACADVRSAWQSAAVAEYAQELGAGRVHLRAELAARMRALTGCVIPDGAITVDCDARRATATLDGVVFRLRGHDLILLRPCAHCNTGLFESPPLGTRADLGHALSGWEPYHAGCEPVDPAPEADW